MGPSRSGGSDRPSDESRITIADHTDDLFAVMDAYGIDRAVVIGWSAGVNIAFEAALRDQRRIAGVLAVSGVPGGSFEALLHPLPQFLRTRAGRVGSHLMRYLGPVLNRLGDGLPGSPEHGFDPGEWVRSGSTSFTHKLWSEYCDDSLITIGPGTPGSPARSATTPRWT